MLVTELGMPTKVSWDDLNAAASTIFTLLSIIRGPLHSEPLNATPVGINTE